MHERSAVNQPGSALLAFAWRWHLTAGWHRQGWRLWIRRVVIMRCLDHILTHKVDLFIQLAQLR